MLVTVTLTHLSSLGQLAAEEVPCSVSVRWWCLRLEKVPGPGHLWVSGGGSGVAEDKGMEDQGGHWVQTSALSAITMETALPGPVGLQKPALMESRILSLAHHRKFPEASFWGWPGWSLRDRVGGAAARALGFMEWGNVEGRGAVGGSL